MYNSNQDPNNPPSPPTEHEVRIQRTSQTYNVARFHQEIHFTKNQHPVRMVRQSDSVNNMASLRKKILSADDKLKIKLEKRLKQIPWELEVPDSHPLEGNLEGGQNANYVLFVMQGDCMKAIPLTGDWYNFRLKRTYKTLTLEEAEAKMSSKNSDGIWSNKSIGKKLAQKIEPEETKPTESNVEKQVKVKRDGDNEDRGEEPDFEGLGHFSDDDEDFLSEGSDTEKPAKKWRQPTKQEEIETQSKSLSNAGKELRKLLKTQNPASKGGDSDSDQSSDEEGDPEKKSEKETRNDRGELNKPEKKEDGSSSPNPGIKGKAGRGKREPKTSPGEKGGKRGNSGAGAPNSKKAKQSPPPEVPVVPSIDAGSQVLVLNEESVRKELRTVGKIKTSLLISKFKSCLKSPKDKDLFANIIKKLAKVKEEGGVKFLLLKDEYK